MDALAIVDREFTPDRRSHGRDIGKATGGVQKDAMDLRRLENMLADIQRQPNWRHEADKCCDFYDGNQLTAEQIQKLDEKGLGPLITNLIKPTVDAVLGLEAKTRTDWRVEADDERGTMVAEFLSQKLYEAERETRADRAISDAYAGEVKAGFCGVEVSRNTNPFQFQYRVQTVHRRELYWDWRGTQPDWSDCRWVLRKRWMDADVLATYFPQHAELIRFTANGWTGDWSSEFLTDRNTYQLLNQAIEDERRTRIEEMEWRDSDRERCLMYEVWYKTWHRGAVLTLPGGRKIEYDPRNQQHVAVVAAGVAPIRVGVYDKMRCAYFIGPHRIADFGTTRRRFPYVPFWGYREDLTAAPYGLVRSMLSPQSEVNARRAKMMWLLSQKRIMIDDDALNEQQNTLSDASRELARADSFVVMNKNRLNKDKAIKIDENLELGQFQFNLLQEAMETVQKAGGVYSAMLGQVQSGVTANSAMQTLIEQGTTTLAEINDNYNFGRRMVGDALLDLIREDVAGQEMQMMIDTGSARKSVYVNKPQQDPSTGQQYLENDTTTTQAKVALADVPSTPSYRAQQLAHLSEVTKSLPPQLQAFVTPFLVESTDLPRRREIASLLRKQLGIAEDPDTPEAQAAMQAQQQKAEAIDQLNLRAMAADIAEKEARANKANAEAQKAIKELNAPPEQADQTPIIRQQFENKLAKIEDAYRDQVFALRTENARIQLQAQADKMMREAQNEQAMESALVEREKEELAAEKELEIARIEADAQAKAGDVQKQIDAAADKYESDIKALQQQIKDLAADMQHRQQIADTQRQADDAVRAEKERAAGERESARDAQQKERDAAREKQDKERQAASDKQEKERAAREKDEKDRAAKSTEGGQPLALNIALTVDSGGSKTIKLQKQADGSMKAVIDKAK